MKTKILIFLSAMLFGFAGHAQQINTESRTPADQQVLNKKAFFTGGNEALNKFINTNFNKELLNEETKGKAYFEFNVDIDGSVADIHRMNLPNVIGFADQRIEEECIRVLELMPAWQPTIISGKKTATLVSIPVLIEGKTIKAGK